MSGPKQKAVPLPKILTGLVYPKRFDLVVKSGADPKFLEYWLTRFPYLNKEKVTLVEGLDTRSVLRIARDAKALAAGVRRVNASQLINPEKVLPEFPDVSDSSALKKRAEPISAWVKQGIHKQKAAMFSQLEGILVDYEGYIKASVSLVSSVRRLSDRQVAQLLLMAHVLQRTGDLHCAALATLLDGAFVAAHIGGYVTVDSLQKLWKRNPIARMIISANPHLIA
jgi:hypothetical protein